MNVDTKKKCQNFEKQDAIFLTEVRKKYKIVSFLFYKNLQGVAVPAPKRPYDPAEESTIE